MSQRRTVLLVTTDPAVAPILDDVVAHEENVHLLVAPDPGRAGELWLRHEPVLVVQDAATWSDDPLTDRQLRHGPLPGIILIAGPEDLGDGIPPGANTVVRSPVHRADLALAVQSLLRLHTLERQRGETGRELDQLRRGVADRLDGTIAVLREILEFHRPGATARADRIGEITARLAADFHVPEELILDLELAARLAEVGWILEPAGNSSPSPEGDATWRSALTTRHLLRKIPALERAADLVGAMYENWDGSGFPEHIRQGQIPLRSRILRIATDFVRLAERRGDRAALAEIAAHSGAAYDPMAVVYLHQAEGHDHGSAGGARVAMVPVAELQAGMVLADDLYTDAGIKLVGTGTRLTPEVVHTVKLRNRHDPIVGHARVRRDG